MHRCVLLENGVSLETVSGCLREGEVKGDCRRLFGVRSSSVQPCLIRGRSLSN